MAGPERFTKETPGRPRRIAVGRARPIDHHAPAAVDLARREAGAQQAVGQKRGAPRPGARQELSAQPEVTAVGETGQGPTESLHFSRDLRRRPGARAAIEERRDERAGAVRRRVLRPRAPGPGRLDGHHGGCAIAQHEDPNAGGSDRADDISPALPRGQRRARGRLLVPRRRAGDDRLQPGRLRRGSRGSDARIEHGRGESLGTQQPGRRRAERRRIDRLQALAVATIVVVVVGDGGGKAEPSRPPLDAIRRAAEIALQEGPGHGRARRRGPGRGPSRSASSIAAWVAASIRCGVGASVSSSSAPPRDRNVSPCTAVTTCRLSASSRARRASLPRVSNAAIRSSAAASSTRGAGTRNPSATCASSPDAVDRRARGADDDGGAATACAGGRPRGTAANARATASRAVRASTSPTTTTVMFAPR